MVEWLKSAVIVIDMAQNLLAPFCHVLEKDTLRTFPLWLVLGSSSKFQSYLYKKKLKFKRRAISWHLRKQVEVFDCPMYNASVAFLRVRKVNTLKQNKIICIIFLGTKRFLGT